MSLTGYCRGRFSISYVILVFIFCVLAYIYHESTPGGYGQWSSWSRCSKNCGEGLRSRYRKCDAPEPGLIGKFCQGPPSIAEKCYILEHCPIDGGLTEWTSYGKCDKTCGGGIRTRIRKCANPVPEYGGKSCEGSLVEKMDCNVQPCPVNGGYSAWGAFSKCEVSGDKGCGKGKHVRTRTCNNPLPQHGGKRCEGAESETAECEIPCPTTPPPSTTASLNSTSKSLNTTSTPAPTKVKST